MELELVGCAGVVSEVGPDDAGPDDARVDDVGGLDAGADDAGGVDIGADGVGVADDVRLVAGGAGTWPLHAAMLDTPAMPRAIRAITFLIMVLLNITKKLPVING